MNKLIDIEAKKCLEHLANNGAPLTILVIQDKLGHIFTYKNNLSNESELAIHTAILSTMVDSGVEYGKTVTKK